VLYSDPIAVLQRYFVEHSQDIVAGSFTYPVGGQAHLSNNAKGGDGNIPPLCGRRLLDALHVSFRVSGTKWDACDGSGGWCYWVGILVMGNVYPDVTLSSRLVGPNSIVQGIARRVDARTFRVTFGPFDSAAMQSSGFDVDVLVTWVGPFFVGQRWVLPDRNDDPPFSTKKTKCLDLALQGSCERFGFAVLRRLGEAWPAAKLPEETPSAPLCTTDHDIGANGAWSRLPPVADASSGVQRLLADSVGLNTFNGSAWRWSPSHCRITIFTKADALQCFHRQRIHNIGLFGDSMMVEFVRQLSNLFDVPIRQGKLKRLRFMEMTIPQPFDDDEPSQVRIRFSRSYTTRGGNSMIASPSTILEQLLATSPEVILGNAAVLHWQQNMMSVGEWGDNLRTLRELLLPGDRSRPWQKELAGVVERRNNAFYLGPTLIQMGRTQGLEPPRTTAFAKTAETILSACSQSRHDNSCSRFRMFWPMNLSSSRREGAYDGQHWACYHTYGGISQMITQLWLNQLCN
jgi:hypothetical protein